MTNLKAVIPVAGLGMHMLPATKTILQVDEIMTNLKAVIPVAGLGMHMLPATKAIPKEMLPIVDKPMIQYIVDEIVAAGIKEILLVTHASKNAVENHFDTSYELESLLEQRVKRQLLAEVQSICPPGVTIMNVTHASKNAVENHFDTSYELESLLEQRVKRQLLAEVQSICPPGVTIMNARQGEPLGLGHSILCARPAIGDNPFVVVLPDVVIDDASADPLRYNLAAMIARFNETGRSQVLAKRMPGDLSEFEQRVKRQLLAEVQSICPPGVTIMNARQGEPLGLGHSILCARPAIGDNPFVVVLPDVVIDDASADPLRYNLAAMIARFNETGRSQVLAKRMPGDLSEYSVIQTKEPLDREGKVSRIVEFIEKPDQPQTLDSDIMAVGRYVLSADIWPELERTQPGAWGRIQMTDAIAELAKKQAVDAMLMTGDSYDCGKKMGYMQAFGKYGLRNLKEGAKFRKGSEKLLSD